MTERVDMLVVGGGVNGASIARDAAGRGLKVWLCEQDDLAAHTSGASTKLIHGGLRYLEQYRFALVGKSLAEREVLLKAAPHIITPLQFVLPHQPYLRPEWMIRFGLFLYDRLGRVRPSLPRSHAVDLTTHTVGRPLRAGFGKGFVYSDARVQDTRLVVLNAIDAERRGACVLTRTRCEQARRTGTGWDVRLRLANGDLRTLQARALVNATGPWGTRFLEEVAGVRPSHALRLVKGSHLVVRKLFDHDYAYIFQQPDRRIVFAIPYENDFTLIGTTDVRFHDDPAVACIDSDEIEYLCTAVNRYFAKTIVSTDVVWAYSGVRPLLGDDGDDEAAALSRDYRLELDHDGGAPLLNVFGGKLTTYRKLAEEAVDRLAPLLGNRSPAWTGRAAPLPGGEFADADFDKFLGGLRADYPWLPPAFTQRLAHAYGTAARTVLGAARGMDDLGEHFGADLYRAEVDYLIRAEWARSAADILWRRSKLGLRIDREAAQRLDAYLAAQPAVQAAGTEEPGKATARHPLDQASCTAVDARAGE
ncbi:MAG: glycerol-3-phosphate dehydrogenase [Luteimonas sp.]